MTIQIDQKIVAYSVVQQSPPGSPSAPDESPQTADVQSDAAATDFDDSGTPRSEDIGALSSSSGHPANHSASQPAEPPVGLPVEHMHEAIKRPDVLTGSTYKIKSPGSEHAMYVTINDIVLNPGTRHEQRRPFEIFISSKNMDQFQWVVALTRIMSAVFRKGGECTFLVEEMAAVFDPRGGYYKDGRYLPSLIAEIGGVIGQHLRTIGMLVDDDLSAEQRALIDEKRAAYQAATSPAATATGTAPAVVGGLTARPDHQTTPPDDLAGPADPADPVLNAQPDLQFPASASLCPKCHSKAVVMLDGCATCLNCAHSKCG